jgi:hypothetical protein
MEGHVAERTGIPRGSGSSRARERLEIRRHREWPGRNGTRNHQGRSPELETIDQSQREGASNPVLAKGIRMESVIARGTSGRRTVVVLLQMDKIDWRLRSAPAGDCIAQQCIVDIRVENKIFKAVDEGSLRDVGDGEVERGVRGAGVGDQRVDAVQGAGCVTEEPAHVIEAQHEEHQVCRVICEDPLDQACPQPRRVPRRQSDRYRSWPTPRPHTLRWCSAGRPAVARHRGAVGMVMPADWAGRCRRTARQSRRQCPAPGTTPRCGSARSSHPAGPGSLSLRRS